MAGDFEAADRQHANAADRARVFQHIADHAAPIVRALAEREGP